MAHFALRNTKNKTGEKKASNRAPLSSGVNSAEKQKGKKEGGLGEGIFARPLPEAKPRCTARKLHGRNRAKISLSFLEFFSGGTQKKSCKGKFLRGSRRSDSGGGRRGESVRFSSEPPRAPRVRQSGFCSKKVRISTKRYRQFTISAFWKEIASARCASAGARSAPDPQFATICHAPRGEKETAWFWIWKFVCAKRKAKFCFANQSFFVSPLAKLGSDNFLIF